MVEFDLSLSSFVCLMILTILVPFVPLKSVGCDGRAIITRSLDWEENQSSVAAVSLSRSLLSIAYLAS